MVPTCPCSDWSIRYCTHDTARRENPFFLRFLTSACLRSQIAAPAQLYCKLPFSTQCTVSLSLGLTCAIRSFNQYVCWYYLTWCFISGVWVHGNPLINPVEQELGSLLALAGSVSLSNTNWSDQDRAVTVQRSQARARESRSHTRRFQSGAELNR